MTSLMARGDRVNLPFVLPGLRSSLKHDLRSTAAELVYGVPLQLPGEILVAPSTFDPDVSTYLSDHGQVFPQLRSSPHRVAARRNIFVSSDLHTATHVFVWCDAVKSPLTPPYDGPYPVIS